MDMNAIRRLAKKLQELGLRQREIEVLEMKYRGLKNSEIGRQLGVSRKVVEIYSSHIAEKLWPEYEGYNQNVGFALYFEGAVQRSGLVPCEIYEIPYDGSLEALPQRQREVLKLVSDGIRNNEIGSYLGCSSKTISTHLQRIMERTGIRNRTHLALLYHRQNNYQSE